GVAKALVNGAVTLADFQPAGLRQPETVALGPRMRYSIEPALGHAGIVEVTTAAGERYSCRVDKPLGDPAKPLDDAQLIAKLRDGARQGANGRAPRALAAAIAPTQELERAPDVSALTALLRQG